MKASSEDLTASLDALPYLRRNEVKQANHNDKAVTDAQ